MNYWINKYYFSDRDILPYHLVNRYNSMFSNYRIYSILIRVRDSFGKERSGSSLRFIRGSIILCCVILQTKFNPLVIFPNGCYFYNWRIKHLFLKSKSCKSGYQALKINSFQFWLLCFSSYLYVLVDIFSSNNRIGGFAIFSGSRS